MTAKLLIEQNLESLNLKGGCTGSSESTQCQNATLLKITCHGSIMCSFTVLKVASVTQLFYIVIYELVCDKTIWQQNDLPKLVCDKTIWQQNDLASPYDSLYYYSCALLTHQSIPSE